MKLDQSPFPPAWWGMGLENVGLKDQRPDVGTYGCYDFASLPPLPIALQGTQKFARRDRCSKAMHVRFTTTSGS